ncbi:class I SAM-dependent methyltransferase [Oxalicibacterium solurbis]|uniref:SAM-dependent methyltransferase n=1 Tax=Oxalicibacterium solurbis TaxID=69280 RepID=A0A8J3B3Q9_9BURK|nr:SAM-dependent methyltransferase [Oxalicibacterium solurbis]GGI54239.1 SAM-dependent methyltransferase [Oxalicibacterium solurbis]
MGRNSNKDSKTGNQADYQVNKQADNQADKDVRQEQPHEIRPGQSIELLKELHILTRDGKLNQDSRRKLKQVYHLYQFIEPLLQEALTTRSAVTLVDHGAGKSYLGFILYDLFFKQRGGDDSHIYGIETRDELVQKSEELAQRLDFPGMSFLNLSVAESITSDKLPAQIDVVTALHACNTATDDAIRFALEKKAQFIVLVPCCQAEVASVLRKNKGRALSNPLTEIWRHPLHTREFGSQVTNVLRCLQLEAHGYQVSVTELVGWEHSMKNELIIASYKDLPRRRPTERLHEVLQTLGLEEMQSRFFTPA